jgi:hypothetical protein
MFHAHINNISRSRPHRHRGHGTCNIVIVMRATLSHQGTGEPVRAPVVHAVSSCTATDTCTLTAADPCMRPPDTVTRIALSILLLNFDRAVTV